MFDFPRQSRHEPPLEPAAQADNDQEVGAEADDQGAADGNGSSSAAARRAKFKRRERHLASLFGSQRTPLSRSNSGHTSADALHPRIYVECKGRVSTEVRRIWEGADDHARKEKKTPAVGIFDDHKQGCLLVIHEDDLAEVFAEWSYANVDQANLALRTLAAQVGYACGNVWPNGPEPDTED